MTTNIEAFRISGSTVKIDATDSNQRVNFSALENQEGNIRVWNSGGEEVFIEIGTSNVTASVSTSMPIPPGAIEIISVNGDQDYLAGICNTGQTTRVYVTPGFGV